jgi:signal transduction histidine kinase
MAYPLYAGPWLVGVMFAGQMIANDQNTNWRKQLRALGSGEIVWDPTSPLTPIPAQHNQIRGIYRSLSRKREVDESFLKKLNTLISGRIDVATILQNYQAFKSFGSTVQSILGDLYRAQIEAARRTHVYFSSKRLSECGDRLTDEDDSLWAVLSQVLPSTLAGYSAHVLYVRNRNEAGYEPVSCHLPDQRIFASETLLRRFCRRVWDTVESNIASTDVVSLDLLLPDTSSKLIQDLFREWSISDLTTIADARVIVFPLRDMDGNLLGGLICISVDTLDSRRSRADITGSEARHFYIQAVADIVSVLAMVLARYRAEQSRIEAWTVRSHELVAPVHAILGYHNNLGYISRHLFSLARAGSRTPSEDIETTIGQFNARFERLGDLCGLMRRITTSISMDELGPWEHVDFTRDILLPVVQPLRTYAIEEKNVRIWFSEELRKMQKLYLRRDAIERCIFNLVFNAIKYSNRGTQIDIRLQTSVNDPFHRIRVLNMGIGVPEGEEDAIFGRFKKGSNADKASTQGAGLGLYVARKIALLHQGTVTLISGDPEETVFELALPQHLAYEPGLQGSGESEC